MTRIARRGRARKRRDEHLWVHTVTTVSTFPQEGLFTKDAGTIARTLASKRVSPKGVTSGLRMLLFFINRAGHGLTPPRRRELLRAKRLMQEMIAKQRMEAMRRTWSAVSPRRCAGPMCASPSRPPAPGSSSRSGWAREAVSLLMRAGLIPESPR